MPTIEELQEQIETEKAARAEKFKALESARLTQELADRKAIAALEDPMAEPFVIMRVAGYREGCPVAVVAVRPPKPAEYKRYLDLVNRATQKNDSAARLSEQERLGNACIVYPSPELRAQMKDYCPGLAISVGVEIAKYGEAAAVEEGKG